MIDPAENNPALGSLRINGSLKIIDRFLPGVLARFGDKSIACAPR
jgi:hypothetical protein